MSILMIKITYEIQRTRNNLSKKYKIALNSKVMNKNIKYHFVLYKSLKPKLLYLLSYKLYLNEF